MCANCRGDKSLQFFFLSPTLQSNETFNLGFPPRAWLFFQGLPEKCWQTLICTCFCSCSLLFTNCLLLLFTAIESRLAGHFL